MKLNNIHIAVVSKPLSSVKIMKIMDQNKLKIELNLEPNYRKENVKNKVIVCQKNLK